MGGSFSLERAYVRNRVKAMQRRPSDPEIQLKAIEELWEFQNEYEGEDAAQLRAVVREEGAVRTVTTATTQLALLYPHVAASSCKLLAELVKDPEALRQVEQAGLGKRLRKIRRRYRESKAIQEHVASLHDGLRGVWLVEASAQQVPIPPVPLAVERWKGSARGLDKEPPKPRGRAGSKASRLSGGVADCQSASDDDDDGAESTRTYDDDSDGEVRMDPKFRRKIMRRRRQRRRSTMADTARTAGGGEARPGKTGEKEEAGAAASAGAAAADDEDDGEAFTLSGAAKASRGGRGEGERLPSLSTLGGEEEVARMAAEEAARRVREAAARKPPRVRRSASVPRIDRAVRRLAAREGRKFRGLKPVEKARRFDAELLLILLRQWSRDAAAVKKILTPLSIALRDGPPRDRRIRVSNRRRTAAVMLRHRLEARRKALEAAQAAEDEGAAAAAAGQRPTEADVAHAKKLAERRQEEEAAAEAEAMGLSLGPTEVHRVVVQGLTRREANGQRTGAATSTTETGNMKLEAEGIVRSREVRDPLEVIRDRATGLARTFRNPGPGWPRLQDFEAAELPQLVHYLLLPLRLHPRDSDVAHLSGRVIAALARSQPVSFELGRRGAIPLMLNVARGVPHWHPRDVQQQALWAIAELCALHINCVRLRAANGAPILKELESRSEAEQGDLARRQARLARLAGDKKKAKEIEAAAGKSAGAADPSAVGGGFSALMQGATTAESLRENKEIGQIRINSRNPGAGRRGRVVASGTTGKAIKVTRKKKRVRTKEERAQGDAAGYDEELSDSDDEAALAALEARAKAALAGEEEEEQGAGGKRAKPPPRGVPKDSMMVDLLLEEGGNVRHGGVDHLGIPLPPPPDPTVRDTNATHKGGPSAAIEAAKAVGGGQADLADLFVDDPSHATRLDPAIAAMRGLNTRTARAAAAEEDALNGITFAPMLPIPMGLGWDEKLIMPAGMPEVPPLVLPAKLRLVMGQWEEFHLDMLQATDDDMEGRANVD